MSDSYGKNYVDASMADVYCDLQNIPESQCKVFPIESTGVDCSYGQSMPDGIVKNYLNDTGVTDSSCNMRKMSENQSRILSGDSKMSVDSNVLPSLCSFKQTEEINGKLFPLDTSEMEDFSGKETSPETHGKVTYSVNDLSEHSDGTPMKSEGHSKIFTVDSIVTEPPCGLQKKQNGNWYCDICGLEEPLKDDILTHRILHLSDDHSKQCPICEKKFSSSTSLRNHLTVHTGIKKFRCKYCDRKFGWKTQLAIHENLHTGKGLHHCYICSKSFMTKWLLQRHVKIHLKDKRKTDQHHQHKNWENPVSKSVTPQVYDKLLEISTASCVTSVSIESQNAKYPRCRECNQSFKTEDLLAYHLLEHNSSKQNMKCNVSIKKQSSVEEPSERNFDISLQNWSSRYGSEDMHSYDSVDQERLKMNHLKNPAKGSLTSIVSKLHHKVDEKQKSESEESTEVHILENSDDNDFVTSLKDNSGGGLKEGLNSDYKLDGLSKDVSKQPMSTSSDPFISGMMESERVRESALMSSNSTMPSTTPSNGKSNEHQPAIDEIPLSNTEFTQLFSKQTETFQKEMRDYFLRQEKQLASLQSMVSSLHGKVDSLTNIVTSQSLIMNRFFLGGKMAVNGLLDFNMRSSGSGE